MGIEAAGPPYARHSVVANAIRMYWLPFSLAEHDLHAGAAKDRQCVQGYKLCPDEPMVFTQAVASTWLLDTGTPPNRQTQQSGRCCNACFCMCESSPPEQI